MPAECPRKRKAGIGMDEALRENSYRVPMAVRTVRLIGSGPKASSYPICPKCGRTMDREYQNYCDRCGQALDWRYFKRARVMEL